MDQDQGSVTELSQKLSISSNKHSVDKKSNNTPSDQSKISSKKKSQLFNNSDDPGTSKVYFITAFKYQSNKYSL